MILWRHNTLVVRYKSILFCISQDIIWFFKVVKCNLSTLMGAKRLKISDVVRETGINRSTVNRLYHETTTRIDYETLEILCDYLECNIGDFLEIVRD